MRICALFLIALAANAQHVNFYNPAQEADLGRTLAESVLQNSTPTSHADVRDYVQELGLRIAFQMTYVPDSRGKVFMPSYRFAVVTEDSLNTHEPIVLPGGYIIVSEHLILAAENEAEFAGMLAHAMTHAAERHATRLLTMTYITEGRIDVPNSAAVQQFKKLSNGLAVFWREFERVADAKAASLTSDAGLDPSAFARYVERQGDTRRAARISANVAKLPARSYSSASNDKFLSLQNELR